MATTSAPARTVDFRWRATPKEGPLELHDDDAVASLGAPEAPAVAADPDAATPTSGWERAATILAISLAIIGALALLARLLFGADFMDEAFYASTAYRFALGARPFIDDLDIHQLAGWLVSPWVRLHLVVFRDTTGIMLSLRLLWALLGGAAAYLWFRALRPFVDWRLALVACTCAFAAIPFMIPAPSYNTVSLLLGSMALALIFAGSRAGSSAGWVPLLAAGVLMGLASVAYPTFVVIAVLGVAGAGLLGRSWKPAAWVLAGGVTVAVIVVALLAPYLHNAGRVLFIAQVSARYFGFGGVVNGGLLPRLVVIARTSFDFLIVRPAIWLALAAALVILLRKRVAWWLGAPLVAALAIPPFGYELIVFSVLQATIILLSGIIVVTAQTIAPPAGRPGRDWRPVFVVVCGLALGVVYGLTSSNSWLLLGFGGLCVMAPVLAVLFDVGRRSLERGILSPAAPLVAVVLAGAVLGSVIWLDATASYKDKHPLQLTTMVRSGPYAGLVTTAANARDTEALWSTMKREATKDDVLLGYHGFPAAYLFTPARPALRLLWTAPWDGMGVRELTDEELASLDASGAAPTIVLRNDRPSQSVREHLYDPSADRLERYVEQGYRWVAEGEYWRLGKAK